MVLETSVTHIVESLESFWNISNAPPSTKAAASLELLVAVCSRLYCSNSLPDGSTWRIC